MITNCKKKSILSVRQGKDKESDIAECVDLSQKENVPNALIINKTVLLSCSKKIKI